jgi:ComF family protein
MVRIWKLITGVLFPVTCAWCGKDLPRGDYYRLCDACFGEILQIEGLQCKKCGLPLPDGGAHCFDCRTGAKAYFECIRSATKYEGVAKKLIHSFKYAGRDYLERPLGKLIVGLFVKQPFWKEVDCVVEVPMHWLKKYLRGYNQAELLARRLSEATGVAHVSGKLVRQRMTRSQFKLSRDERKKNVDDSFAVNDRSIFKGKTVLLVDDVCTTAATINQCARALRKAGALKVYALTVARD